MTGRVPTISHTPVRAGDATLQAAAFETAFGTKVHFVPDPAKIGEFCGMPVFSAPGLAPGEVLIGYPGRGGVKITNLAVNSDDTARTTAPEFSDEFNSTTKSAG